MQDELNQPLPGRPKRAPARVAPAAAWVGRLALVAVAAGAAAVYWRDAHAPQTDVAVIPFDAIEAAPAPPAPAPSPTVAQAKVFPPPPPEGGVSVMRGGQSGHTPQIIEVAEALGNRLPPAPDKRVTEPSKYGALPRVGVDGTRPADVYARPFTETAVTRGAPRIAVFVGGLGLDPASTQTAIARLPAGVSLGIAPYGNDLPGAAERARTTGHEVWLQAPMQAVAGADPGPHTLKVESGEAENRESLHWLMGRFAGYVGVAGYLGGKFTADADALSPVLAEVARRGLLYLDDGGAPVSKAADLAPSLDLKAARADIVADGSAEGIDAALARAEDIARRKGSVLVTATALPLTLEHVARWAQSLEGKGFALAPVSSMAGARPDRAARAGP